MNPKTQEWLEAGLESYLQILTLEDFILRHGVEWGFDQASIEMAAARAERFDQIVGAVRYTTPPDA